MIQSKRKIENVKNPILIIIAIDAMVMVGTTVSVFNTHMNN
jgi:hypothetical protein